MSARLIGSMNSNLQTVGFLLHTVAVVLVCALLVDHADAKMVIFGQGSETVRVQYGNSTIFRFQKPVQTITGASRFQIKPANKLSPSYDELEVVPRFTNGTNDVMFFLTDKSVVKLKIVVVPNDPTVDSLYDFKSRDNAELGETENAPPISEVELLKGMVRDGEVSGYKVSRVSQSISSKNSNARIELIRIYKGSPFNGYVFKVSNTSSSKALDVDVRHFSVGQPNLAILSQSDEATLDPRGKGNSETIVRIVVKNTATSADVILAMESEEPTVKKGD